MHATTHAQEMYILDVRTERYIHEYSLHAHTHTSPYPTYKVKKKKQKTKYCEVVLTTLMG